MDGESPKRDVKNHVLFEFSTEVAHRGEPTRPNLDRGPLADTDESSRRNLLGHQVQGRRDDCRVWRSLHTRWAAQPTVGTFKCRPSRPLTLSPFLTSMLDRDG